MAKPTGFNKQPHGKLGSTVSYNLLGTEVIRGIGKLSKEEYHQRESFEGARKNWSEFGMASGTAKLLRQGLQSGMRMWCGPYISGRLTGALRRIVFQGSGEEGKRGLETAHFNLLHGLALNRQKPKQAFLCTSDPIKIQTEHALVSLDKCVWELESCLGVKLREYHQITIGVIALSEIHHLSTGYQILHPGWHGLAAYNSISGFTDPEARVQLEAKLEKEAEVPGEVGVIGVVGVW